MISLRHNKSHRKKMVDTPTDLEITEALDKCRNHPFSFEHFAFLHNLLDWGGIENRKRNLRLTAVDFAFDWLRHPGLTDVIYRDCLWDWIQAFVIIDDLENDDELTPIKAFVERGGIELAVIELDRPDCMFPATLLSILSWCCMVQSYIPRILCTNAHFEAMAFIEASPNDNNAEIAMSLLRALAGRHSIRESLLNDGLMERVLVYLKDLTVPKEDIRLRRAFRAASIICRLSEFDTSGEGQFIIRRNPQIITVTLDVFHRVLVAGPTGTSF
jgi:hypothetical protein